LTILSGLGCVFCGVYCDWSDLGLLTASPAPPSRAPWAGVSFLALWHLLPRDLCPGWCAVLLVSWPSQSHKPPAFFPGIFPCASLSGSLSSCSFYFLQVRPHPPPSVCSGASSGFWCRMVTAFWGAALVANIRLALLSSVRFFQGIPAFRCFSQPRRFSSAPPARLSACPPTPSDCPPALLGQFLLLYATPRHFVGF